MYANLSCMMYWFVALVSEAHAKFPFYRKCEKQIKMRITINDYQVHHKRCCIPPFFLRKKTYFELNV